MTVGSKINLLNLSRPEMEALFVDLGEKPFRASQVFKWIYQLGVIDFNAMTNLSKNLRAELQAKTEIRLPTVTTSQRSADGTHKWVLDIGCGNHIETVFIPEEDRGTLCVSSQAGCALSCRFCSTAQQGFNRNLKTSEIIGQIWIANKELGYDPKDQRIISNVVLMGMGEPLLNFENVVKAMDLMMDDFAYGLSKRRITLSTAGVVPAIERLRRRSDVSLAVSLHAPTDELRNQLVPLNEKYPIAQLLDAYRQYMDDEPRRKVTFEYVMITKMNDRPEHARQLIKLLSGVPSKVNLIPFNPYPNSPYRRSSELAINAFREQLMKAGLITLTRKTRGDDIDAACGQLAGKVLDKTKRTYSNPPIVKKIVG